MRIVIIGVTPLSINITNKFLEKGHEVIIVEGDQAKIESYSQELDCSFIKGDATHPHVLEETNPKETEVLLCITEHDQNNIISGLVGKSLGFQKVYISISDLEWEKICTEVGLNETIVPVDIVGQYLEDIAEGHDTFAFRKLVKEGTSLFSFVASEKHEGPPANIELPSNARIVWLYRDGAFMVIEDGTTLKKKDEIVIATHQDNIEKLQELFEHETNGDKHA